MRVAGVGGRFQVLCVKTEGSMCSYGSFFGLKVVQVY